MSDSTLVTYARLSPNHSGRRTHKIDTVTIHCIVGQWTAKKACDFFMTASCAPNYSVGKDGSIGQSVREANRAWTSGGKDENGKEIRVNGISGADNDQRAITIEVASDTTHPYAVTDAAYKALIDLLVDICQRNGIKALLWKGDKSLVGKVDQQNMTVHRWFAYKSCPGDYLYQRHGQIAAEVNARLGATPPATGTGNAAALYRVQTGAFSSKANADAYAKKIKAAGFDTYIVKADGMYKVQVGAYSQKANAEAQMKKLTAAGYQAFITTKSGEPV